MKLKINPDLSVEVHQADALVMALFTYDPTTRRR